MATLTFHGAADTVTGSRHLLELDGHLMLVDCGLFQGTKPNRRRNWDPFPVSPDRLHSVWLTHAHIDHTGYLPRLVRDGYRGPVYCTRATADLLRYLLPDTARLQQEEAEWANKKGFTRHAPAEPLFNEEDAARALSLLHPVDYGDDLHPAPGVRLKYRDAGHILGSAHLDVKVTRGERTRKIVFGGDLGRPGDRVLKDPVQPYEVDYLVLESTYGDRLHGAEDPASELVRVVRETAGRGGVLVVPSFAVGRTQTVLFLLRDLEERGLIPELPVYVDSPMAVGAHGVFEERTADLNLSARLLAVRGVPLFRPKHLHLVETRGQSKQINAVSSPAIIIAGSGMATGGRILHHLVQRLPEARNTVLLVGYQAEGTRGRSLQEGKPTVRIHGQDVPVRARVETISGFSGHADYEETLAWLLGFARPPERTFLVHGEPTAMEALAGKIRQRFGWTVDLASRLGAVSLDL